MGGYSLKCLEGVFSEGQRRSYLPLNLRRCHRDNKKSARATMKSAATTASILRCHYAGELPPLLQALARCTLGSAPCSPTACR